MTRRRNELDKTVGGYTSQYVGLILARRKKIPSLYATIFYTQFLYLYMYSMLKDETCRKVTTRERIRRMGDDDRPVYRGGVGRLCVVRLHRPCCHWLSHSFYINPFLFDIFSSSYSRLLFSCFITRALAASSISSFKSNALYFHIHQQLYTAFFVYIYYYVINLCILLSFFFKFLFQILCIISIFRA